MKQSITLLFGVLSSMVAAVPLEKRLGYTTTVIEDVTDIVDVYTTVYVSPGDPRLTLNQQPAVQTPSSVTVASVTPVVSSAALQPVTPPSSTSQVPAVVPQQKLEAAIQVPAPSSTPVPSVTPQAAAPKEEAAAPVQPSPTPVSSPPTPPSSTPDLSSSGGACGQVNGKCTAENVTTFGGGLGSCGYDDAAHTQNYFALAHEMMGEASNSNPNCGRSATIVYNGQNFYGTLTDKCMGCGGASLDLSLDLFNQIFPTAGGTGNFHNIEWYFTS